METSTEDDDDNTRGYSPEDVKLLTRSSSVISASPPEVKPDHSRCIVHFDIDSFYAQVEEVLDPRLRGKPIGIRQKYLLVTCNYPARRLGAKKMESAAEAKRRCPSLIVMDGEDLTRYREASEKIFSFIAGKCGPLVQRLGMDEIFADVTELIGSQLATEAANGNNPDVAPLRAVREESGEAAARTREPRPAFTGHLYAPGTGGRLLEAQTGTEISLGDTRDATMSGAGQSDDDIREHAALSTPYGGERTIPTSPVGNADHLARDRTRENDGNAYASGFELGRCSCGCVNRLAAASAFAERVRRCLRDDVGYTCSAGIGCSKAAAKLAGELHKPDQQTTILPWHVKSFVSQLPLRKLPGCGYSTCAKIKSELGVTEVRQLQRSPWPILVRTVGDKLARALYLLCRGEDPTPVAPSVRPKTMSDEDSFKRGSVRSREKVETNIRRLAASLLLRAGERVRLHKEAPTNLRLGVRRASKGYGHRITRQCAVSPAIAVAWGDVGDDVAAAAAAGAGGFPEAWKAEGAAKAKAAPTDMYKSQHWSAAHPADPTATRERHHDSDGKSVDVVLLPEGPRSSPLGVVVASEDAAAVRAMEPPPGRSPKPSGVSGHGGSHSSAAEEALSEVVRLSMGMFDKICSSEERLDITLLSVGFAGFRSLGGSAQTGMARYLATPGREGRRVSRRTDNRLCASAESWDSCVTHVPHPVSTPRGTGKRRLGVETPGSDRVSIASSENPEYSKDVNRDGEVGDAPPHSEGQSRKVSRDDDASSNHSGCFLSSGRSPSTKHPRADEEGRGQGSAGREGSDSLQDSDEQRGGHGRERLPPDDEAPEDAERALEDAYAKIWEEAEVLVVGAGGDEALGRGKLDWCGPCKAYVLRADAKEHTSSEFHGARVRLSQAEECSGFEESKSSAGCPDRG